MDINNVSSFEDQIDEETNEWEYNERRRSEDEYDDDFDISSSK